MLSSLIDLLKGRSSGRHRHPARDDRGATAVEYGLMVGFIAVVIVLAVTAFGKSVEGLFVFIMDARPFG